MAFEIEKWLGELQQAGSLSAEETTALKAALGKPGAVKFLEESQLRQSDYSRRMGELQQKETATVALQQDLIKWKTDAEGKLQAANLSVGQERAERAKIEATLKHVCETNGIDPAFIGLTSTTSTTTSSTATTTAAGNGGTPPNSEYLTKKDWEAAQEGMRRTYPLLPAILGDIDDQHRKLGLPEIGTYSYTPQGASAALTGRAAMVQKAMDSGKPISQVWEEEFKVAERRTAIQEEAVQARINAAVQAHDAKIRSELNLPAPRPVEARSPILEQFKPPSTTGQPEKSAVQEAVEFYNGLKAGNAGAAA